MSFTIAFFVDSVPFTPEIIAGTASLGGSESACLGLARGLAARGHHVHIFATRLSDDAPRRDHGGVLWHPAEALHEVSRFIDWDVFCALRMPQVFGQAIPARLRILWNQDMLVGEAAKNQIMSLAWAYDKVVYVSQYQRKQWDGVCPELAAIGWVTKNGFDASLVPSDVKKVPHRIIHITRPERGLTPLLAMWPDLKRRVPDAELQICRYQSMYDGEGSHVKAMCESFDRDVQRVNAEVGGITYLGSLGKPDLYRAIAEASVMWYPGVVDFAETSCIAAIEAQACGTPFVGSYKGALPETVHELSGVLIKGDAMSPEYQAASVGTVEHLLSSVKGDMMTDAYWKRQEAGRQHVQSYTYDAIASEWEQWLIDTFATRYVENKPAVLRQLLHEDDLLAARVVAVELGDTETVALCDRVSAGIEQTADDYSTRAMDPRVEALVNERIAPVVAHVEGCRRILDVACGNGSFVAALLKADPERTVVGVDYAPDNIETASAYLAELGLSERAVLKSAPAWMLETQTPSAALAAIAAEHGPFDAIFAGEFLEHVWDVRGLLHDLHRFLTPEGRIVFTVPSGPFVELLARGTPLKRGHVHHFHGSDLTALFGEQRDVDVSFLDCGETPRGNRVGHWIGRYTPSGEPLGERPIDQLIATTRPMQTVTAGLIVHNAELDLPKCLDAIYGLFDEILVADCGSDNPDATPAIVEAWGGRYMALPRVPDIREGFAGARNAVLNAATSDWFLWIDADELLVNGGELHTYIDGNTVFRGFAVYQKHLHLDAPMHSDTPVRLFRRGPDIQFYGCIHEQPQMGDCNGDILPTLQLNDVQLAHTGYLHEGIRRDKALRRNLPLLIRDQQVFPDRVLGKLLVMRDFANLALWSRERSGGQQTEESRRYLANVVGFFEQYFSDPTHKLHDLARPFYEQALSAGVAGAFEVELAFAAEPHGIGQRRAQPMRFWVRRHEDIQPYVQHKVAQATKRYREPAIDVEPWAGACVQEQVVA